MNRKDHTYTKLDDTTIKETYTIERTIDINMYFREVKEISERMKELPKKKNEPDQETLEFWNENNVSNEINELKERANYIISNAEQFKESGILSEQWEKTLEDFKKLMNNA